MQKLVLGLFISFLSYLPLTSFAITGQAIEEQQDDQSLCEQQRFSNCLDKCDVNSGTDCQQACQENAKNECRQAGE